MRGTETVTVRRLTPDDWAVWRDVRLAALADAPHAYGSTLAHEQGFDEARWRDRVAPENGVMAVALLDERVVGAVGGHTPPGTDHVLLVAMWVHPEFRGGGAGDALVGDVLAWARENGWRRVVARVVDGNAAARRLFVRHGFVATGAREPLESDTTVSTEVLECTV